MNYLYMQHLVFPTSSRLIDLDVLTNDKFVVAPPGRGGGELEYKKVGVLSVSLRRKISDFGLA